MSYADTDKGVLYLDKDDGKCYSLTAIRKMARGFAIQKIDANGIIEIQKGCPAMGIRSIDGLLYSADGKTLLLCPYGRTGHVDAAGGTETIAANAFENPQVTSVGFPGTLKAIGDKAFECCRIDEVAFPPSVERIGRHNFLKAKTFHLDGGKPIFGLFKSWKPSAEAFWDGTWGGAWDWDAEESTEEPYAIIDMAGKEFAMPLSFEERQCRQFLAKWDAAIFDMALAEKAFEAGATPEIRRETALAALRCNPGNEGAKILVKKEAKSIALRYIRAGKDDVLVEFLKGGFVGQSDFPELIEAAKESENKIAAAYILEAAKGAGADVKTLAL